MGVRSVYARYGPSTGTTASRRASARPALYRKKSGMRLSCARVSLIGRPLFSVSSWNSSGRCTSSASASAFTRRARGRGASPPHSLLSKALRALATARSTSRAVPCAVRAITAPVAGFLTSSSSPEAAGTSRPSMKIPREVGADAAALLLTVIIAVLLFGVDSRAVHGWLDEPARGFRAGTDAGRLPVERPRPISHRPVEPQARFWLVQSLNGLALGGLLFLLSSGFSLIFGLMRVPNLSHGAYFMLGAYVGLSVLNAGYGFWPAVLAGGAAIAIVGGVIERVLLRRLAGRLFSQVLVTLGIAFIIADASLLVWSGDPMPLPVPRSLMGAVPVF